ncbi:MAG: hypothetical protein JSS27_10685 [Planctomycetes bacterium]|nr:hypothetical protein [Planctomycetota bacterium]
MSESKLPRRRDSDRTWLGKLLGRRQSNPIERVRRALHELTASNASQPLRFRAGDDCTGVDVEFNALAEHVERLGCERDRALEQAARQAGKSWTYAQPASRIPENNDASAASAQFVAGGPSTF